MNFSFLHEAMTLYKHVLQTYPALVHCDAYLLITAQITVHDSQLYTTVTSHVQTHIARLSHAGANNLINEYARLE